MTPSVPEPRVLREQAEAAVGVIEASLGPARVIGIYLYGSAVSGGLRPDSDLDLFVVVDRRLTDPERRRLVDGLLPISGRSTRPPEWRPIEATVVAETDVRPWRYPPHCELQYGEWLRSAFEAGDIQPRGPNPDLAVLITMVRASGRPIRGPAPADVLDPVPRDDLVRATIDSLPDLLADLDDDTRNVLLTLARMWCTLETGEIRSKDAAADWALDHLPMEHRPVLARARDLYLDGGYGSWADDAGAVTDVAEEMARRIRRLGTDGGSGPRNG